MAERNEYGICLMLICNKLINLIYIIRNVYTYINKNLKIIVFTDKNAINESSMITDSLRHEVTIRVLDNIKDVVAIKEALLYAKAQGCKYVVVVDADGPHDPTILPMFVKLLTDGYDLVVGSRLWQSGYRNMSIFYKILIYIIDIYTRFLLPKARRLTDIYGNYFGLNLDILNNVNFSSTSAIIAEIVQRGNWLKAINVYYIPKVSKNKRRSFFSVISYFLEILRISPFIPLLVAGITGVGVNLGVLMILIRFGFPFIFSSPIAVIISILNNYIIADFLTKMWKVKRRTSYISGLGRFFLANAIGTAVQILTSISLYSIFHTNYILAQFFGIVVGFLVNYIMNTELIWK